MLLIHATIHTMISEPINDGFLHIKDGKIENVGSMNELPKELLSLETIDLKGKTLLPGFIDAHSHLGMNEDGVGDEGEDINEMSDPATPHIRAIDAIDPLDRCFEDARKVGVTTAVSSPGSSNPIAGEIVALKTAGNCVDKMAIAKPLAMKFAMGENPKGVYSRQEQTPMSRMAIAGIIRENLMMAQRYKEDKEHAQKEDDSLPDLEMKYEALIPVLEGKIKAHFHAHRAYDIQTAIRIAKEFHLDYVIVHGTEGHRIADYLAEEGASVICGPLLGNRSKPELSRQTLDNCSVLLKAGVEVAISSDHPEVPVEFLPLSASILVNHGITYEDALLGMTYRAAKILGLDDRIGSIQKGLDADLIVLDGDLLHIKTKPEMVFVDGQSVL